MTVLIAGAGIGGLTTALCLLEAGFDVQLVERAAALEDIGAGIQMSPNAVVVLDALGLGDALRQTAVAPQALEMRDGRSGQLIFSLPTKRWQPDYLHLHRADLIGVLAGALRERAPDALQMNTGVTAIRETADAIEVDLCDGRTLTPALLIGADGIRSTVRDHVTPNAPARFTGNAAWRATVPVAALGDDAPERVACVWTGPGRHAVTYRLRGGTLANLVGVVEQSDWRDESWVAEGDRETALADFAGWHPTVTRLLEAAGTHYRWGLFERPPLARWHTDRCVLVGDACHAMLPFLSQGAAMAIEDAWLLAAVLRRQNHQSDALANYQRERLPRVQRVFDGATRNARTFHLGDPLRRRLTYGGMRIGAALAPALAASRLDWLYGVDITREHPLA